MQGQQDLRHWQPGNGEEEALASAADCDHCLGASQVWAYNWIHHLFVFSLPSSASYVIIKQQVNQTPIQSSSHATGPACTQHPPSALQDTGRQAPALLEAL